MLYILIPVCLLLLFILGASFYAFERGSSAIGYYEPGHYCFIAVNGRGKLRGISLAELSQLCADLGMAAAYNMDGGQSSALYFNGKTYGNNGRTTSDIAYIAEVNK